MSVTGEKPLRICILHPDFRHAASHSRNVTEMRQASIQAHTSAACFCPRPCSDSPENGPPTLPHCHRLISCVNHSNIRLHYHPHCHNMPWPNPGCETSVDCEKNTVWPKRSNTGSTTKDSGQVVTATSPWNKKPPHIDIIDHLDIFIHLIGYNYSSSAQMENKVSRPQEESPWRMKMYCATPPLCAILL